MKQSRLRAVDDDRPLVLRQSADGTVASADLPGGVGFGWTADELAELSLTHLIHPDDRLVVERGRSWCLTSKADQVLNLRIRAPGGRWQWYEATVRSAVGGEDSAPIEMALRDISETTLPQEALTLVIGLRNFIDVAPDVDDVLIESARRITQFAQFDRAYVWARQDSVLALVGSVGDIAGPPQAVDLAGDGSLVRAFDAAGPKVTEERQSRDPRAGNEAPVTVILAPMVSRGEVLAVFEFESRRAIVGKGVVAMVGDVLDQLADSVRRKGVEVELDIAQQQLAVAFNEAPIGMALTTIDGRFLGVNRAASELLDRDRDALLTMTVAEVSHSGDAEAELRFLDEVLAGERDRFQTERRYLRPDGSVVQALSSVAVVRDPDGVPIQLINQMVDISAQKAREFQIAHRFQPPEPGSAEAIEALDAFLQAQASAGLPTGVVWLRADADSDDAAPQQAVAAAMDAVRAATRNGDYFAAVTSHIALIAVAAFADDRDELSSVVTSVGHRIRSMVGRALDAESAGGSVSFDVETAVVDSKIARAARLFEANETAELSKGASHDEWS